MHSQNVVFVTRSVQHFGKCQIVDEKHEKCSESGPYGSVWGATGAESIAPALGSLWDASRTSKPL